MNGAPKITYDFVMGQLRIAMVAVLAYGGGKGWWTPQDAGLLSALGASIGPIAVPWAWSIMTNLSTVHVASGSAAAIVARVERLNPIEAGQAAVRVAVDTGTKIAAVLLLAIMLFPSDASAQIKLTGNPVKDFAPKAAPAASGVNVTLFQSGLEKFNSGVQTITKEIVDFAIADVQAALDDATKKNDEISAPCWQAHLNLLKNLPVEWDTPPKMPIGIALGIQIQRDILNTINGATKGTLKVDCAALYGDELKALVGVGALLGIKVASGGLL